MQERVLHPLSLSGSIYQFQIKATKISDRRLSQVIETVAALNNRNSNSRYLEILGTLIAVTWKSHRCFKLKEKM